MQTPVLQRIPGPAGLIETAAMGCALSEQMPAKALLLLHPHPLHGGTMANKVVTTLARAARDVGLSAVAFNFRGVGRSEGVWDHGEGEAEDALAVARQMIDAGVETLLIGGFSFGASMAAKLIPQVSRIHRNVQIADLIQVAPAVENFPIEPSWVANLSPCVLFNTDDEVVSVAAMQDYAKQIGVEPITHAEGGHFYHGQLTRLKAQVTAHWHARELL